MFYLSESPWLHVVHHSCSWEYDSPGTPTNKARCMFHLESLFGSESCCEKAISCVTVYIDDDVLLRRAHQSGSDTGNVHYWPIELVQSPDLLVGSVPRRLTRGANSISHQFRYDDRTPLTQHSRQSLILFNNSCNNNTSSSWSNCS